MVEHKLDYLFHHVFLPPCVPQSSRQTDSLAGDRALHEYVLTAAQAFRTASDDQDYQRWSKICSTLRQYAQLHRHDNALSKNALVDAFRDVEHGGILLLHVAMQNSGLIVRKADGAYLFESFEASASAADVLAAKNALQWVRICDFLLD